MANLLFLAALLILPFFIISQTVTLRLEYISEPVISIDFIFFCLWLYPARKRRKKKKRLKLKKRLKYTIAAKSALERFLADSEISLNSLRLKSFDSSPSKSVLKSQGISSLFNTLTAYLSAKAKNIIASDSISDVADVNNIENHVDIVLYSSIKNMLFSFFYLIYQSIRRK